ncbi:uncharacterized protein LOC128215799 isoform X2 [Mya arenaria]|uniref:uncharacterized protein LOC128215799 isoform X2 n=1 Tax=Mya arenaria TaxID=6604 RepID=UPI0022DF9AA3|nr:uncharacterized protein LOC128215799 isoform X2 [Mya arenaria]
MAFLNTMYRLVGLLEILVHGPLTTEMSPDLDICVCNPRTDKFTTYDLITKTRNPAFTLPASRTRRRYNDFQWLRKTLQKHHPLCVCPELPERKHSQERFEIQFLVQRMKDLEDWLLVVVRESLYLSDSALHLFLQSSLSCDHIDLYIRGCLAEDDVSHAYTEAARNAQDSTSSPCKDTGAHRSYRSVECKVGSSCRSSNVEQGEGSNGHRRLITPDSGLAEEDSDSDACSLTSSHNSSGSASFETSPSVSGHYPPLTEVRVCSSCPEDCGCGGNDSGDCGVGAGSCNSGHAADSLDACERQLKQCDCQRNKCTCGRNHQEKGRRYCASCIDKPDSEKSTKTVESKPITRKVEMGVIFSVN